MHIHHSKGNGTPSGKVELVFVRESIICQTSSSKASNLYFINKMTRLVIGRAGPTTAFGRVVGRQAYTKICADQLCNMCCEYHYIIYTHLRDNYVVYHHRARRGVTTTTIE